MRTSISSRARLAALSLGAALLAVATTTAHHSILAKFDDTKAVTLTGIVTLVDWTNPHVHVFMNVRDAKGQVLNWAVELESPIDLKQSGWSPETLRARRRHHRAGHHARATAAARCGRARWW